MPHEACFDSFEAEMLEPCGLSAIWVLSTFSSKIKNPISQAFPLTPVQIFLCTLLIRHPSRG